MSSEGVFPSESLAPIIENLSTISSGFLMHKDSYNVSSGMTNSNSCYVYDSSNNSTSEIYRESVTMRTGGESAYASLGVLLDDAGIKTIQPVITTCPESTVFTSIGGGRVCNLTLDGSISWDRDDACLYLSANKAFRFRYVEADQINPSRLVLEGYNDSSTEYVAKIEFSTD